MKRIALLTALIFCLVSFASGCLSPVSASDDPSASPGNALTNQMISETDFEADSGNPVRSLYKKYLNTTEERSVLLQDALNGDASLVCTEASLQLWDHSARLSEGLLTLGWLLPTDSGEYASYISGTLAGSGTITAMTEAFLLHYAYADGKSISGTLQGNRLTYTCYGPEETFLYRVTILGEDDAWLSLTESEGTFTLVCFQSDIRLLTGPVSASTPTDADSTISQILNDYSGRAEINLLYSEATSSLTQAAG